MVRAAPVRRPGGRADVTTVIYASPMAESKPKRGARSTSTKKPAAKKPAAKSSAKASAAKSPPAAKKAASAAKKPAAKPAPDIPARIDGLRGWLDQIERRQGRMTYITAAGLLIALACAGVALYLGVTANQDMAKQSDLDSVKEEISKVGTDSQAKVDASLKDINSRLDALTQQVSAAQQQAQQAQQQAQQAAAAPPAQFTPAPGAGSGANDGN
jgi:hypothetical protein